MKRVILTPERIREGLPPWLLAKIEDFKPLRFPAGRGAANWLREHITDPCEPWKVVLTFDDHWQLLGFFALAYKRISLPPDPEEVAAMEVAWIARANHTPKGFGRELLTYAASMALDAGAAAFVVSPHDKQTARKVWIERFSFRSVSTADHQEGVTMQVFLGLQEPTKGGAG